MYVCMYVCMCVCVYVCIYIYICISSADREQGAHLEDYRCISRRRENMVGVNMVGVNMAFHDAICECFEGAMLEPCLLKPWFHVAGGTSHDQTGVCEEDTPVMSARSSHMCLLP